MPAAGTRVLSLCATPLDGKDIARGSIKVVDHHDVSFGHKEEHRGPRIDYVVAWSPSGRHRPVIHLPCHLEEETREKA